MLNTYLHTVLHTYGTAYIWYCVILHTFARCYPVIHKGSKRKGKWTSHQFAYVLQSALTPVL